jgi:hypothetical protein
VAQGVSPEFKPQYRKKKIWKPCLSTGLRQARAGCWGQGSEVQGGPPWCGCGRAGSGPEPQHPHIRYGGCSDIQWSSCVQRSRSGSGSDQVRHMSHSRSPGHTLGGIGLSRCGKRVMVRAGGLGRWLSFYPPTVPPTFQLVTYPRRAACHFCSITLALWNATHTFSRGRATVLPHLGAPLKLIFPWSLSPSCLPHDRAHRPSLSCINSTSPELLTPFPPLRLCSGPSPSSLLPNMLSHWSALYLLPPSQTHLSIV